MATAPTFQLINHPSDGLWHIERDGVTVGYAFPRREGGWGASLFLTEETPARTLLSRHSVLAWARRALA